MHCFLWFNLLYNLIYHPEAKHSQNQNISLTTHPPARFLLIYLSDDYH